jgi:hypothetical protein
MTTETTNRIQSRITENDGRFYALIVCVEKDGYERVLRGYAGRYFATRKNAERSTAKYIAKHWS